MLFVQKSLGTLSTELVLQKMTALDVKNTAILLPFAFFCLAAFTKSAQVPFESWLCGAMFFEAKEVTPQTLLSEVQQLANAKYRFVTMSQTVMDENTLRLFYHFDVNLTMSDLRHNAELCVWEPTDAKGMVHLRMDVNKNERIPSITPIYFCAVLVENETQDQFGVRFADLPLDYEGAMNARPKVGNQQKFGHLVAAKKIQRRDKTRDAHHLAAQYLVGWRVAPQGLKFLQGFVGARVVVAKPVKIEPVKNLGGVPRWRDKLFPCRAAPLGERTQRQTRRPDPRAQRLARARRAGRVRLPLRRLVAHPLRLKFAAAGLQLLATGRRAGPRIRALRF